LRRIIAKIMRRGALEILEGKKQIRVTIRNLKEYLEKGYFGIEPIDRKPKIGVVQGLAWTPVGGDTLRIEAVKYRGKGGVTITGQLGDVMKESAHIAFTLVKTLIDTRKLKPAERERRGVPIYSQYNLHIHVPEGAIPKDGPSAGIALTTAIASLFSGQKVRGDLAMTGEITLTGEVLPVGGIREKLIAAYKAKIKEVLLPVKNYQRDIDELPEEVKGGLKITPVRRIEEVLERALLPKEKRGKRVAGEQREGGEVKESEKV
ncbi:MAG: S16 family serine protease, partial [Campylobacterales bacterium]